MPREISHSDADHALREALSELMPARAVEAALYSIGVNSLRPFPATPERRPSVALSTSSRGSTSERTERQSLPWDYPSPRASGTMTIREGDYNHGEPTDEQADGELENALADLWGPPVAEGAMRRFR